MNLKQSGIIDSLFKAKIRDNGTESEYTEDEYHRFCSQLEKAFPVGTLDFTSQQIGMNILTKLTKVLRESKHIRSFKLYGNLIRDHGIHSLLQLLITNPKVVILDIGCNDFTNQAVPCLIDIILNTTITSLQIGATSLAWHNNKFNIQSLIDILIACNKSKRIKCLGLSGLKMSIRQGARRVSMAENLASFIRNDLTIRSLSIADCGFTPKDMETVAITGLLLNDRLKFLDLHNSALCDPYGTDFMRQIGSMRRLAYFDISNCQLTASAGVELAKSLKNNRSLVVLNLNGNQIGDAGFGEILKVLLDNQTLTEIDVTGNAIGPSVAPLLESVIKRNHVLYSLNMTNNLIGDDGAFAIASSIGENEGITKLSIASCRITDDGAIAICHALVSNTILRRLMINDNFLTRESGYQIIDALRGNEHLFVLDLTATQIDHFVIKAVNDLCVRNRQIQKETDLQPLKKQLIQLSIQQTKMPEAEMRLRNLENTLDDVVQKIVHKEGEIETRRIEADSKLKDLRKDIQDVEQLITEEKKTIQDLEEEGKKLQNEHKNTKKQTEDEIAREKSIIATYEEKCKKLDSEIKEAADEHQKKKDDLNKELEELQRILDETMEIMNDPDAVRNYEPPKLEFLMDKEDDPLFLVDQLDDLRAQEKGGKKNRKRSPKKGKKKGK
ncbi:hypothetical protein TRFO_05189 [Tritrichomonas foetus]|uniref:Leucine Rich Repeat family protein n=1 Tax=Tritrichomonas foetus TaxID=1144522 RepID=A0A1J4K8L9_9EUKA|nr:hypothetical protein TRFO_05189 [Tritrichomonas foetus]|eukprot:OHT07555.1 hypothetical protein TRFO_05189 [Tritrichomonas foetus]